MSAAGYEANALLGAYLQGFGYRNPHQGDFYRLMGRVAGNADPDDALAHASMITQDSAVPFGTWAAANLDTQPVQTRIELQQAGDDFAAKRKVPMKRLGLGDSRSCVAHLATPADGAPVVIKTPFNFWTSTAGVEFAEIRLRLLVPCVKIEGYEQPLNVRYKKGILGTSYAPGIPPAAMTPDQIRSITDGHLEKALDTITAVSAKAIGLDFVGTDDNMAHDPAAGIGFFDAQHRVYDYNGNPDPATARRNNLKSFRKALGQAGDNLPKRQKRELEGDLRAARRDIVRRLVAVDPNLFRS